MSRINDGRLLAGGLAAGVAMNVCDFVWNAFVLANESKEVMIKLNLDPAMLQRTVPITTWILVDFVFGLLIVFTYAGFRPRFGAGPKTAVIAGLVLYVGVTAVMLGLTTMGLMTVSLFVKSSALSLISVLVGSLVGGAIYREAN